MSPEYKKEYKKFKTALQKSNTEEDVKNVYAKHFKIDYDTSDRHDLYTPQILFEFKYDKNLQNLKSKAAVLAQILYYIHRLKYGFTNKAIPVFLCLANKNEAIISPTIEWKEYYSKTDKYDWDLTPSNPDKKLIEDLSNDAKFIQLHNYTITENEQEYNLFFEKLTNCLSPLSLQQSILIDKKIINEENFEEVFEYWNGIFGSSVQNGFKTSKYFVCDIQEGRTYLLREQGKVFFEFSNGEVKAKKILLKDYDFFWQIYQKVTNIDTIRGILSKIDRLTDEEMRRFHGKFFTPVRFARKALEYIEKTAGKEWWKTGKYRIWDMAAGTGNLEWHLPSESYPFLYLSTLSPSDVEHCEKLFPEATVFQYDYLNNDVGNVFYKDGFDFGMTWKLPQKLRNDLANPEIKWIILINPPFATSQKAGLNHGQSKQDVSNTAIRKIMHQHELGEVSRELFSQFIFRIKHEFENKDTLFGLFSKVKYLNANNDQKFRDNLFHFEFQNGFIFSSLNFSGTKGKFPVGFLLWNLSESEKLEEQTIVIDIFDDNVDKIAHKQITSQHKDTFLSKWINRPAASIKFPPVGSAINLKINNKDRRDRIAIGFVASLMCAGNDFQHQNNTALLSAPYVSAGALSVTPKNFEKAMVVHAVRRIPKATWINDRDQFLKPTQELETEFINDCTIWNLFSNSNQTAALKDVIYEKETYQIQNHFFPFLIKELKKWQITDSDIQMSLTSATDRFIANWIKENKKKLSKEAKEVIEAGELIYQFYFKNLHQLRTHLFKIQTWDVGFWQIKQVLKDQNLAKDLFKDLKEKHDILTQKIEPQIYENGFISKVEL